MPVVINNFDFVADTPAPTNSPGAPAATPPAEVSPAQVMAIVKQSMERAARVRAH
jgi:hypothetical protein